MKNKKNQIRILILLILFVPISLFAQRLISIETLVDNPGPYIEEAVSIEGIIVQFIPESSSTNAHYVVTGKFGGNIKVKTSGQEPKQGKKYRIKGTVYSQNGTPFIHEESKQCLDCTPAPSTTPSTSPNIIYEEPDNTLLYLIIGLAVVFVIVIVVILTRKNTSSQEVQGNSAINNSGNSYTEPVNNGPIDITGPGDILDNPTIINSQPGGKTIILNPSPDPRTMRFIPGKFKIVSETDNGFTFPIAGYPTFEGSVVTIGRTKVTGDRAFAHIEISSKLKTVSRKQAELLYKNGELFIRNLSNANPTQVDGVQIDNQLVPLHPNAVIRAGELELQYIV